MNEIMNRDVNNPFRIFDYKNLGSVRTFVDGNNEVWFCAVDVCNILELAHVGRLVSRLNPKGVLTTHTLTNGGKQELTFINEPNLYETIFKSRKPEAEDLKRWVFTNVLPSIRKTGSYDIANDDSLSPQTRAIVAHDRRINSLEEKYIALIKGQVEMVETIEKMEENYSDLDYRIEETDEKTNFTMARQDYLIDNGYHSVFQFAHYMGVDVKTIDTNRIGRICSKICKEKGIPMGTYPDGKYMVNTYPYKILNKVFNEEVFIYENSN